MKNFFKLCFCNIFAKMLTLGAVLILIGALIDIPVLQLIKSSVFYYCAGAFFIALSGLGWLTSIISDGPEGMMGPK